MNTLAKTVLDRIAQIVIGLTLAQCEAIFHFAALKLRENSVSNETLLALAEIEPVVAEPDPLGDLAALPLATDDLDVTPEPSEHKLSKAQLVINGAKRSDGTIWAHRRANSPVISGLSGKVATDAKGTYFVMAEIEGKPGEILCKKLDDAGNVHGQSVVREIERVKIIGNGETDATLPAQPTDKPVSTEPSKPVAPDYPLAVPSGKTHMVFVNNDGKHAMWSDGQVARMLVNGKKGRMVLNGTHPQWTRRLNKGEFNVRFVTVAEIPTA